MGCVQVSDVPMVNAIMSDAAPESEKGNDDLSSDNLDQLDIK